MSQPTPNNVEPKLSGDMASHLSDNSAMGVPFKSSSSKVPMTMGGDPNTLSPVSTPSDGGGNI